MVIVLVERFICISVFYLNANFVSSFMYNNIRRHADRDTVSRLDVFEHVERNDRAVDGAQASDWTAYDRGGGIN